MQDGAGRMTKDTKKGAKKTPLPKPRASDERWMVVRMSSEDLEETLLDLRGLVAAGGKRANKSWVTNVSRVAVIRAEIERREKIAPNQIPMDPLAGEDVGVEFVMPEPSGPPTLTKYTTFVDLCLLGFCRLEDAQAWVTAWEAGEPAVMAEEPLSFSLGLFADEVEAWEKGKLQLDQVLKTRKQEALARGAPLKVGMPKPAAGKPH
jgi:hypothetical protein